MWFQTFTIFNALSFLSEAYAQVSSLSLSIDPRFLLATQNWALIEPYIATLRRLPRGQVDEEGKLNLIRFYLYSDLDTPTPQELILDDLDSIQNSNFNSDYPVKILIHGFGHNFFCSSIRHIKNAYLWARARVNVIAVDWPNLARNLSTKEDPVQALLNYDLAVQDSEIVGRKLGNFITFLVNNNFISTGQVHIVGFSIGSHIAGYAARQLERNGLDKIDRITGLDPAGPLYATGLTGRHLMGEDADFVDFVHTDLGQTGTSLSLGQVNFFVNGGIQPQPGCEIRPSKEVNSFVQNIISAACSHSAAVNYYAQSILVPNIQAKLCSRKCTQEFCDEDTQDTSDVIFGEHTPHGTVGTYCLNMRQAIFPKEDGCNSLDI